MREILFKAKQIGNGEWVEGWIVPTMSNTYPDGYRIIDVRGINYDELDYWEPNFISWKVDETTICQYTGLTDKNGNKIWENDIVECKTKIYHFQSQIEWDTLSGGFLLHDSAISAVGLDAITKHGIYSDVQVIGNIFDNPEILEGSEQDE